MGPLLSLFAEQSTMTTESGSDSESKPEQEAEPQEAAGPQGHAGGQPGPEPGAEEQPQAPEQFEEAAAHSTPVRKEVRPDPPAQPANIPRKPFAACLLSLSRLCSDCGVLALERTTTGHLLAPSCPSRWKLWLF